MGIVGNPRLEHAIACKVNGDYDKAINELRALLSEEPQNGEAHHQLGLVFCFTGEFDQSLEEVKKAVELDVSNLVFRNTLAKTYAMLSMYDEAIVEFKTIQRMDPNDEYKVGEQLAFIEMML